MKPASAAPFSVIGIEPSGKGTCLGTYHTRKEAIDWCKRHGASLELYVKLEITQLGRAGAIALYAGGCVPVPGNG